VQLRSEFDISRAGILPARFKISFTVGRFTLLPPGRRRGRRSASAPAKPFKFNSFSFIFLVFHGYFYGFFKKLTFLGKAIANKLCFPQELDKMEAA
jgi:hypothetical protein